MQRRLGMPLIVAFLGGTGTGKSTLINALLGAKIVREGKQRPTTDQPILVCRPEIDPERWGIDISDIRVEKHDLPALRQMVLIDCPDPDTTENDQMRETNLARLREVLPLCDILVVTGTQQKYRSRKVADELADAAPGARLVFVQTHADRDVDIRKDWADVLAERYEPGTIYYVDSLAALSEQLAGKDLTGDFGELYRLLTREMNEEAAFGVREANYFDLAEETASLCDEEIEAAWPRIRKLQEKIADERLGLGAELSDKVRTELVQDRQLWENRLIGQIAAQWGYSPFSLVLRTYQRLGSIAMGMLLARARSVPQLVALGTVEGVRSFRKWSNRRRLKESANLEEYWEDRTLRESALVLAGFAEDAQVPPTTTEEVVEESARAGEAFTNVVAKELDNVCEQLTRRHNTLTIRIVYETLVTAMLIFLLARPAKNFFYDSFFYGAEVWPLNNYLVSIFWLIAWCGVLLGVFTLFLRRGLERQVNETAANWRTTDSMRFLFGRLETTLEKVRDFRGRLQSLREKIDHLNRESRELNRRLGRRK